MRLYYYERSLEKQRWLCTAVRVNTYFQDGSSPVQEGESGDQEGVRSRYLCKALPHSGSETSLSSVVASTEFTVNTKLREG